MKYGPYVLRHLRHSWLRTTSTVLGMALCIFLICTLRAVLGALNESIEGARPDRLATRHAVSIIFNMPYAYRARIAAVPGVTRITPMNYFGGLLGGSSQDFANFFASFAVDPTVFADIYPEYAVSPEETQAFLADRRAAIIGRGLARKFGWAIGSPIQLESFIPYYQIGRPFEFVVRGIFDVDRARYPGGNDMQMLFRFDYLFEATRQRSGVGMFIVQVDDPARAAAVGRAIDDLFENSDVQTKTESEAAFTQAFIEMTGNLVALLNGIAFAVAFTVLLVTANTMSMAVRERRTEIAILKTLGFSTGHVMALVLAEALFLGMTAGILGVSLAGVLVVHLVNLPYMGALLGQFPPLRLSAGLAGSMLGVAALLGLAAGWVPAWLACRAPIIDTLRAA